MLEIFVVFTLVRSRAEDVRAAAQRTGGARDLAVARVRHALLAAARAHHAWFIGIANVVLPGKGLRHGPFVTEEEILTMADVAAEEAAIETEERELIHSIFEFGDTVVREVMLPRTDMVAVEGRRDGRRGDRDRDRGRQVATARVRRDTPTTSSGSCS